MLSVYRSIMDPAVNPLRHLPPVQRFQMMTVLAMMWTAIFCAATGAWFWYGELIVGHVLIAMGLVVTGLTFHRANRRQAARDRRIYRDHPALDGTSRFDDVWGA